MKITAFICLLISLPLIGCEEDELGVGFEVASGFGQESDGTQQISINLGKKVTSSITISYIVEGESRGVFSFQLIDDGQPEPRNEFIYVEITGISDPELNATLKNTRYSFEIEDNDTPPSEGLQVDLTWSVGEGVSINAANFDLYVGNQVQLSNGEVTAVQFVEQSTSANPTGFESTIIAKETDDQSYYIIIRYVEGTMDAELYLNLSQGSNYGFATGRVTTGSIGHDLYYGPITKTGNHFVYR